jgi:hypothetical protein
MERPPAHYKTTRAPHLPNLAVRRQHLNNMVSQGQRSPYLSMGLPEVPWSHGDTRRVYQVGPGTPSVVTNRVAHGPRYKLSYDAEQYKTIHTLLDIPYLQPPHPTVRHLSCHLQIGLAYLYRLLSRCLYGLSSSYVQLYVGGNSVNSVGSVLQFIFELVLDGLEHLRGVVRRRLGLSLQDVKRVAHRACCGASRSYRS